MKFLSFYISEKNMNETVSRKYFQNFKILIKIEIAIETDREKVTEKKTKAGNSFMANNIVEEEGGTRRNLLRAHPHEHRSELNIHREKNVLCFSFGRVPFKSSKP